MIGGLMTELICSLIILESKSVMDVVKDFIALGCIAEVDNIMLMTCRFDFGTEKDKLNLQMKPDYMQPTTYEQVYNVLSA